MIPGAGLRLVPLLREFPILSAQDLHYGDREIMLDASIEHHHYAKSHEGIGQGILALAHSSYVCTKKKRGTPLSPSPSFLET